MRFLIAAALLSTSLVSRGISQQPSCWTDEQITEHFIFSDNPENQSIKIIPSADCVRRVVFRWDDDKGPNAADLSGRFVTGKRPEYISLNAKPVAKLRDGDLLSHAIESCRKFPCAANTRGDSESAARIRTIVNGAAQSPQEVRRAQSAAVPNDASAQAAKPWYGKFEGVSNFKVRHTLSVDRSSIAWTEYDGGKSTRCSVAADMNTAKPPAFHDIRWNCEGAAPSSHAFTFDATRRTWTIVEGSGNLVERVILQPSAASPASATACNQADAERELLTAARSRVHNFEAALGRSTTWTQNRGECSWAVVGLIGYKDPMGTPVMYRFGATVLGNGRGGYAINLNLM